MAVTEVESKTPSASKDAVEEKKPLTASERENIVVADIARAAEFVAKAVVTQESRFTARAMRSINSLRKRMTASALSTAIKAYVTESGRGPLLSFVSDAMDTDGTSDTDKPPVALSKASRETDLFFKLLALIFAVDQKQLDKACELARLALTDFGEIKARSCDMIGARCYFYFARAHELKGDASSIRSVLHNALRTASIRVDDYGKAVLINLLLRNYLNDNLVHQADMLVAKAGYPEGAPNNETARYLYYLGRIRAITLDYTEAHQFLVEATRKAPKSAIGFRQCAHKFSIIVELLLGEIPEREIFKEQYLKKPLEPYFLLTQAVRLGDLGKFNKVVKEFNQKFVADGTSTLIMRLRRNVIKTGVRMISLSYSRIYLSDVAAKLQLDSVEDAEYIVSKCIRDGVIDATINHEQKYMQCKDIVDLYATGEPQEAYHQRVLFCLKLHNESIKAMRYPPNAYRKYLETSEQRRQREQLEAEIAEELEQEDDEP